MAPILLIAFPLQGAVTVAEYVLPQNANGFFNVGAGMGTDDGRVYDNRVAQTFVATTSGYLEDVFFNVSRFDQMGLDAELRLSVTNVLGGQPGEILESTLLPYASVGTDSLSVGNFTNGTFTHKVTLSATVFLESGETYALVFSSDTTESNYRIHGYESGYAQGTLLKFQDFGEYEDNLSDLLFRVAATPIPEPDVALLAIPLGLMACLRRRRSSISNGVRESAVLRERVAV